MLTRPAQSQSISMTMDALGDSRRDRGRPYGDGTMDGCDADGAADGSGAHSKFQGIPVASRICPSRQRRVFRLHQMRHLLIYHSQHPK